MALRSLGQGVGLGPVEGIPVNAGRFQLRQPDAPHRYLLALQGVLGVLVPPVGGGDDDPLGEALFPRRGQEGVDVLLADRRPRCVELALDRHQASRECVFSYQVNTGVVLAAPGGPVLPQPHLAELVREHRVGPQELSHQPLQLCTLVRLGRGLLT